MNKICSNDFNKALQILHQAKLCLGKSLSQKDLNEYDKSKHTITEAKKQLEILLAEKELQNEKLLKDHYKMKEILSTNDVRNAQVLRRALLEKFSNTFSEAQIDHLLQLKKRINWSEDDITKAITLRSISKKSYTLRWNEK